MDLILDSYILVHSETALKTTLCLDHCSDVSDGGAGVCTVSRGLGKGFTIRPSAAEVGKSIGMNEYLGISGTVFPRAYGWRLRSNSQKWFIKPPGSFPSYPSHLA